jgi:proteasome-associated ATPase
MAKNNTPRPDDQTPEYEPVHWSEERFSLPETHLKSTALLDQVLGMLPPDDPRAAQYLMLLRHQLETDERQFEEARQALVEFEEAYEKLTQPANRIGVYLGQPESGPGDTALVAVGDQEFVVNIDPNLDADELKVGTRIMVNDAYAVVGVLGPAQSGSIAKIGDVLDENRLRVSTDPQGLQGRIVYRGEELKDVELKTGDEVRMEPNFKVALELFAGNDTKY